jgi:rRNA maturation endonuclease Nob1
VPELREGQVRVIHVPSTRICSTCASTFEGIETTACPVCGGPPLPSLEPEEVELELDTEEAGRCA